MNTKSCFYPLLVFILFIQTVSVSAVEKDVFTAKFRDPSDTVVLGSAFTVKYYITGDLDNVRELSFPDRNDVFGNPIALEDFLVGNSFGKNSKEITSVVYVDYAFTPLKTGTYKIPRAYYINSDKKKKQADELTVTVIEPKTELPHHNIVMQMPQKLKQYDDFELTIYIEGQFETDPTIYLHQTNWLRNLDGITAAMPAKVEKTSEGIEYTYRFRPHASGTFFMPNVLVWFPDDEIHGLSNTIGYVEVAKGNPSEVLIKTIAPKTAIVGQPFLMYFNTRGISNDGKLVNISPDFDPIKKPLTHHADFITYSDKDDGLYMVDMQTSYILNHVLELRATKEGKYSLPAIKFNVKGVDYVSDTASITILPASDEVPDPFSIAYRYDKDTYQKGEELRLSLKVDAYSAYLDKMQVDINKINKELAKSFDVLQEKSDTLYTREASVRKGVAEVSAEKTYIWKLKTKKNGQIVLPAVTIEMDGKKYVLNANDTLTVKSQIDKEDITVDYPKKTAINMPIPIVIKMKNWRLMDLRMGAFDKAEMDTLEKVDKYQQVLVEKNRYSNARLEYKVIAKKTGVITIPSILVKTEAGDVYTDPISIEVLPADINSKPSEREPYGQMMTNRSSLDKIMPDDAFIKSIASAYEVYQNQGVYITDYLYTSLKVDDIIHSEATDLAGFHPDKNNVFSGVSIKSDSILAKVDMLHVDGRNYNVYPLRETLFFPSAIGQNKMLTMKFDIAFNAGGYRHTRWDSGDIKQPAIMVKPLPEQGKPASFEGLIGKEFDIMAQALRENDTYYLTITIEGDGNLPLFAKKNLMINNPNEGILSFEEEYYNLDLDGISEYGVRGTLLKEYVVRANKPGKYTIPAIEISYFDTDSKTYITKKSDPVSFKID